nr:MAG TPA_asm: hypothetical protein [Caudoviricetes sp.]
MVFFCPFLQKGTNHEKDSSRPCACRIHSAVWLFQRSRKGQLQHLQAG